MLEEEADSREFSACLEKCDKNVCLQMKMDCRGEDEGEKSLITLTFNEAKLRIKHYLKWESLAAP